MTPGYPNYPALRKKMLGSMQGGFVNCPFDILVAISDDGTIKRDMEVPEVVKADQVPTRIQDIVTRHKKAASFFCSKEDRKGKDGMYSFADEEMAAISSFLLGQHVPLSVEPYARSAAAGRVCEPQGKYATAPAPRAAHETAPESELGSGLGVCDKCEQQCLIKWGRYSYYWKCIHCNNNMAIKEVCPSCNQKIKLRKDRNRFFSYCDLCNTGEALYCEFESV